VTKIVQRDAEVLAWLSERGPKTAREIADAIEPPPIEDDGALRSVRRSLQRLHREGKIAVVKVRGSAIGAKWSVVRVVPAA